RPAMGASDPTAVAPAFSREHSRTLGTRIRVGLLLDGQLAPRWIHQVIDQLLYAEHAELAVIVLNRTPRPDGLCSRSIPLALWKQLDTWVFRKSEDPLAPELRTYQVSTIALTCVESMGKRRFSETDVARIREFNLDVLV